MLYSSNKHALIVKQDSMQFKMVSGQNIWQWDTLLAQAEQKMPEPSSLKQLSAKLNYKDLKYKGIFI